MKTNRKKTSKDSKMISVIICTAAILVAAGAIAIGVTSGSQHGEEDVANQDSSTSANDTDTMSIVGLAELTYNPEKPGDVANRSTNIAVVRIKSIDGVSNYGNGVQQYVHPYTYGEMEVIQNLSGDIREGETVKFSRLGGTMPFDKYLEGLSEAERTKLSNSGSSAKNVKVSFEDDIDIAAGKTYLVYLVDSTVHYAEPGAYEIIGFGGGLREVQTASAGYSVNSNSSNLKVLNNFTGEWENLSDVVKQDK